MKTDTMYRFVQELKRRRVFRGIVVYGASTLVLFEAATNLANFFGQDSPPTWFVVMLGLGFFVSLWFSWIYDITPGGIRKTEPGSEKQVPIPKKEVRTYQTTTFVSVLLIIALVSFNIIKNARSNIYRDLESGETVKILSGHWDTISAVRVFDAGKRAVSSSWDGTLKIWDLETGLNPLTINCHQGYLFGVTVFDKGRKAVSVGRNRTLKVWNLETGEAIRTLEGHKNEVWYASVYDNGQRAVSTGKDSDLRFWNLETGELLQEQERGIVTASNNEQYIISATSGLITVWDSHDGKKIKEIANHSVGGLLGITISDDDQRIYICGSRGRMDMIDLNSGEVLRSLQCHHAPLKAIAVFDDGWKAITASDDQTLRIWDLQAKEEISTLWGLRFAVFPDMRRVLIARPDRSYFIYDSETGNITEHVKQLPGTAETLAVFPDSKHAVAALKDGSMWILDLEDKNRTINCFMHEGVKAIAVDPGGRYFVSVSQDRSLRLWEMKRLGDFISTAEYTGDSPFTSCMITPDGRHILAGDNSGRIHFLHLEGVNRIDSLESI